MRARLLAGSALIPAALALAPAAKADVFINGVNRGNLVSIGQFSNSSIDTTEPEVIGLNSTGSFLQNSGTNLVEQQSIIIGAGATGSYALSGGSITAGFEDVGRSSTGNFVQTGGTNTVIGTGTISIMGSTENLGTLIIAENAGSTGTYNLSGGTLTADTIQLNQGGTFAFNGGTANYGKFNLSGGSVTAAGDERLGTAGTHSTSTFTQTGGTNTVGATQNLSLGQNAGTTVTYNLQGGSITTGGLLIGLSSNDATMNQSGGTASAAGQLVLGVNANSVGTYNLSGASTVTLGADSEIIGQSGTGSFTQSGGTNTVTHTLTIAQNQGSSGTYALKDGALSAETITVNQGGTLSIDNGKLTFGALNITGGTVTAAGDETVVAAGGFGNSKVMQTGGTNTVAHTLAIGQNQSTPGAYDLQGGTLTAQTIEVKQGGKLNFGSAGTANFSTMSISGGAVTSSDDERLGTVGTYSTSTVTQTAGSNTVVSTRSLQVGFAAGTSVTYNLEGGSMPLNLIVGYAGTGTFNQTGGTLTAPAGVTVGLFSGSNGTYSLQSGTLSGQTELVGDLGGSTGTFIQSGGTNTASSLTLAVATGATGTYDLKGGTLTSPTIQVNSGGTFKFDGGTANFQTFNLSGGTVTASGDETLDHAGGPTGVTVNQTGGSNTVGAANNLTIGNAAGNSVTYDLSGGSVSAGSILVGNKGNGTLNQTGGTVNASTQLVVGAGAGSQGSYSLSGTSATTLTTAELTIGEFGTGSFTQSGGAVSVGNELLVGFLPGSTGTYTQAGGTVNVGQALILGLSQGSQGSYSLSSGTLTVGHIELVGANSFNSGTGTFTQTGGTNDVSGTPSAIGFLQVGAQGSTGSYTLSGGTLKGGDELIGSAGGTGTLTQTGGTNTANFLTIADNSLSSLSGNPSSGSYDLAGGTLTAFGIDVASNGGSFKFDGGTANFQFFTIEGGTVTASGDELLGTAGTYSTSTVTQTSGSNTVVATNSLQVGFAAGTTVTYNLEGGSMSLNLIVGNSGTGIFNQTGGTLTAPGGMILGLKSGSQGTYNLSGTGSLTTPNLLIGESGTGTFNQSGGSVRVSATTFDGGANLGLIIGGPGGSYNLSGGALSVGFLEDIAEGGNTGSFIQSGGTNTIDPGGFLAVAQGGNGSYTLSGGALVGQTELIGHFNGAIGTFTQSGGTNTATSVTLGVNAGASGTYTLSGTGSLTTGNLVVGDAGTGSFSQSGGTNTVNQTLALGGTGSGTYTQSGGTLSAKVEQIGYGGLGTFTQSGGTNSTGPNDGNATQFRNVIAPNGDLLVGVLNGGKGTYNLQGGTLQVGADEIVGTFAGSTGTFNQTGGTHNVGGAVVVALNAGATGTFDLQGGTLTASTIQVNSGGTFKFDGGTANFAAMNIAGGAVTAATSLGERLGTVGTYTTSTVTQTGGSNTVGSNGSLIIGDAAGTNVTYNLQDGSVAAGAFLFVGNAGTGTFNQSGGSVSTEFAIAIGNTPGSQGSYVQSGGTASANVLALGGFAGSVGTYTLKSGGTLSVNEVENIGFDGTGTFIQTGGTNTAGAVAVSADPGNGGTGTFDLSGGTLNTQLVAVNQGGTFVLEGGTVTMTTGFIGTFENGALLQVQGKGGTINGDVTNTGTVKTLGTSVTFNGTFTNSGTYQSFKATQRFGTLTNTTTGTMQGAFGDRFVVTGDFLNHSTHGATWSTAQSVLNFAAGGASHTHTMLLTGANLGIGQAGYQNNFAWGGLEIDAGESLILGDGRTGNLERAAFDVAAPAAFYVQDMLGAEISGDEVTNITGDGLDIYYDPFLDANAYLGGLDYALVGGGELIADDEAPPLPEPGTLALLAPGIGLVFLRRGRGLARS